MILGSGRSGFGSEERDDGPVGGGLGGGGPGQSGAVARVGGGTRGGAPTGPEGWGPERWGPKGGAQRGGRPKMWGAQNFAFFPSRHHFRPFCLSLGVFSWNFCVFEGRDPQMCTFGLSCETPAAVRDSFRHPFLG